MTQQEKPYLTARTFMFSVQKGDDLLQALQGFCHHYQIRCGVITAVGAVERATFSTYDQKAKKYVKLNLEQGLEILSLCGNVSLFDDKPMVHAHITFGDSEGRAFGGHLMAGTMVFSCEIFIQELSGDMKTRKLDKATQLPLWTSPVFFK